MVAVVVHGHGRRLAARDVPHGGVFDRVLGLLVVGALDAELRGASRAASGCRRDAPRCRIARPRPAVSGSRSVVRVVRLPRLATSASSSLRCEPRSQPRVSSRSCRRHRDLDQRDEPQHVVRRGRAVESQHVSARRFPVASTNCGVVNCAAAPERRVRERGRCLVRPETRARRAGRLRASRTASSASPAAAIRAPNFHSPVPSDEQAIGGSSIMPVSMPLSQWSNQRSDL